MIDIEQLTEKDIGTWVEFTDSVKKERGKIKSWNLKAHAIYVVYKCGGEWERFQDFTGVMTKPSALKFIDNKTI